MVDEAQDTNRIQFELMSFLTKRKGGNTLSVWDDFSLYIAGGVLWWIIF